MSSPAMTVRWRELRQAALRATRRDWPVRGQLSTLQPGAGLGMIPVVVTGSPPRFLVFTAADSESLLPDCDLAGMRLHGGPWVALPPTATEVVLAQRWWTAPSESVELVLPTQVVLDALLSSGGLGDGLDEERRQLKNWARSESRTVPCALVR